MTTMLMLMTQIPEGQEGRWRMRAREDCLPSALCQLLLRNLSAPCCLEVCLFLSRCYNPKTSLPSFPVSGDPGCYASIRRRSFFLSFFCSCSSNWLLGLRHWLYFRYQK
jgi:hypothetical protein